MMLGYGLWVMGTNSAYAREGSVVIVHWPLPVRFGTIVTPSGKVVPMKKHRHSCKYSAAVDLKVWFARGAIELPCKEKHPQLQYFLFLQNCFMDSGGHEQQI